VARYPALARGVDRRSSVGVVVCRCVCLALRTPIPFEIHPGVNCPPAPRICRRRRASAVPVFAHLRRVGAAQRCKLSEEQGVFRAVLTPNDEAFLHLEKAKMIRRDERAQQIGKA
jgi:hypothetical protein